MLRLLRDSTRSPWFTILFPDVEKFLIVSRSSALTELVMLLVEGSRRLVEPRGPGDGDLEEDRHPPENDLLLDETGPCLLILILPYDVDGESDRPGMET